MNTIRINNDIAVVTYKLGGLLQVASIIVIVFSSFMIYYFYSESDVIYTALYMFIMSICVAANTYKIETRFDRCAKTIQRKPQLFWVAKNTFMFFDDHYLLASLKVTEGEGGTISTPMLWLVDKDDNQYEIGEFSEQDIDLFAKKIEKFSGLKYIYAIPDSS